MSNLADRYEKRFPGTGCSEAQKEERMERIDFRNEAGSLQRTSRTRGVVIPRIPWHEDEDDE